MTLPVDWDSDEPGTWSASATETYPPDNGYTLLRTLAKIGGVVIFLEIVISFLLPLRDSYIKLENQEAPICVGYDSPLKTHLKGK